MKIARGPRAWRLRARATLAAVAAGTLSFIVIVPAAFGGVVPADTATINGSWRWVRTLGGWGENQSPDVLRCERRLTFMAGSTYIFVEYNDKGRKQLCHGTVTIGGVGPRGLVGRDSVAYATLEGWWWPPEREMQIWLMGPDTLAMYPGGRNLSVSDASEYRFVRVTASYRPPVVRTNRDTPPVSLGTRSAGTGGEPPPGPGDSGFGYIDEAPVPVVQVPPTYPESARSAEVRGTVILHALIGVDGRVKGVKVIRGITGLNVPAVTAMKQWVYKPALRDHEPVAVWIEVSMEFPPRVKAGGESHPGN